MRIFRLAFAAILLAAPALVTVAPARATPAPQPTIVRTVPSDAIGGLPIRSLDGKTAYIPQASARPSAGARSAVRPAHRAGNIWPSGATGYDISWPNCPAHMPTLPPDSEVAVVGVNDGTPFTALPCMDQELAWSPNGVHAQYMILDSPIGSTSDAALQYAYHGPAGDCAATDHNCQAFNWGWNAAGYSVGIAQDAGATSRMWWLDVELPSATSIDPPGADCYKANFWTCDTEVNSLIVKAAVARLKVLHQKVGAYSTQLQWAKITGGLDLGGLPIWIAGWHDTAAVYCDPANAAANWFAGGKPWLVQSLPDVYDPDTAC